MRSLSLLFLLAFLGIAIFPSCEKVDNPFDIVDTGPDTTGLSSQFNDTTWNDTTSSFRRILLEDYTGHTCGNCPAAASTAESLHDQYGDTLLVVSVHAGVFAEPASDYPADFRTTAGEAYDNFFKVSTLGNPNGLINRRDYTAQNPAQSVVPPPSWGTKVSELTSDPVYMQAPVDLVVRNIYNTEKKISSLKINGKVNSALAGDYELVAWITESGIVSPQKDYSKPAGQQKVYDYIHNHMLRKSLPDTWGNAVITGSANAGDTFEKTFNFEMDPNWIAANCEIVVVLYAQSNREVIQSAKLEIGH